MDDKTFLGKRRDRAIATLLGFKERECDEFLPDDVSQKLRKEILDQINELCDIAFDLLGSAGGPGTNQIYLDKIDEIHEMLVTAD
jgi:hypothetical protein